MQKSILIASLFLFIINKQIIAQSIVACNSNAVTYSSISEIDSIQQKKQLTRQDYKLWNSLSYTGISDNGDWYAYSLQYEDKKDTLFVGATKKEIIHRIAFGISGEFSPRSKWFICLVRGKGLALLNLENNDIQWFSNIIKFEFYKGSTNDYLIGLSKPPDSSAISSLMFMDLNSGKKESIMGVTEYLINSTSKRLAYIVNLEGKKAVALRKLELPLTTATIVENSKHKYKNLSWTNDGSALVFLQEVDNGAKNKINHKVCFFSNMQGINLQTLDSTEAGSIFSNMNVTNDSNFRISEDGATVFFKVQDRKYVEKEFEKPIEDEVQVWAARDKLIYPQRKSVSEKGKPKLAAWWPEKNKMMLLENDSLPEAILTGDRKHMLSYNTTSLGPHFGTKKADFYITDLETNQRNQFLKNYEYGFRNIQVAPGEKYVGYFRDKHWWVYDLKKKTHTNVTKKLVRAFYKTENENAYAGSLEPYGSPGWTHENHELIVYDKYDVWLVSREGKYAKRLTHGRESQVRYRIDEDFHKMAYKNRWSYRFEGGEFNIAEGLMLKSLGDNMASGYLFWKNGKQQEYLVYKNMNVDRLKKVKSKEAYIYVEQSFNISPRLMYLEKGSSEPRVLVKTNPQQTQFQWGSSELLTYLGSEGQPLNGALFYPANYVSGKKYPMIVNIYELISKDLHHYVNPTEYNGAGFNTTNYTTDGYFVFKPDIKYEFNNPGISALNCVKAGVKAVMAKGIVEKKHIGLTGHSFGGYETNFIITQTDIFAAAIASAGSTNQVSHYHTVNGQFKWPQMEAFEGSQYRYEDSFYENPEAYFRNSPIHHAKNINIPLLLMTGKEDHHVNWQQSVELYLGLRRLGKECKLLIYPKEGHILSNPKNQLDFTRRTKNWFDKYLKVEEKVEGI